MRLVFVPVLCGLLLNPVVHAQPVFENHQSPILVADLLGDVVNGFIKGRSRSNSGKNVDRKFDTVSLDTRCQNFMNWSGKLQQEYPNVDLGSLRQKERTDAYAKLFDDTHFVPFFGQPYDTMSETTLADIGRNTVMACQQSSTYRRSITWQYQLLQAFPLNGSHMVATTPVSYSSIVPKVREIRQARSVLQSLTDGTDAMPLNATSYIKLTEMQNRLLLLVWPSEQAFVNESFNKIQSSLVAPALGEIVDQAIASSQGYEGLMKLRELPVKQQVMFNQASAVVSEHQRQRLQTAQDKILRNLMAELAAHADQFPNTPGGVKEGALWYQSTLEKFMKFPEYRNHPEVQDVDALFWNNRNVAIAASEKTIDQLMRSASTLKQVRDYYSEYIWLEGDKRLSASERLFKLREAYADKLLKSAIALDLKNLDEMPGNIERLKLEAKWYQAFLNNYAYDMDSPHVKELDKHFWQRRTNFINSNQRMLTNLVSTAQDEKQLYEFWDYYLCLSKDRGTKFVTNLENLSIDRRQRLELKKVLAHKQVDYLHSPNGEPSEAEMYDEISGRLSRIIKYFSKDGCQELQDKKGFRCKFSVATHIDSNGAMNTGNGVIDKTPSGWIVVSDWSGRNKAEPDPTGPMEKWQQQLQKDADHNFSCLAPAGLKPLGCP